MIKVNDLEFEVSIPQSEIASCVDDIASRINHDYAGKNPLLVVMLSGAFIFAADLVRHLDIQSEVSFAKYSSYDGMETTGVVRKLLDVTADLKGRDVIIVEDIIDTGTTMSRVVPMFKNKGASSVRIAALLLKPGKLKHDIHIDYVGKEIPNDFILGYGLDYDGYGRNFADIYTVTQS